MTNLDGSRRVLVAGAVAGVLATAASNANAQSQDKRKTLCGHSYGGFVVSGDAEKVGDRLEAIVYADAFVPEDRENLSDQVPRIRDAIAKLSAEGKIAMPVSPSSFFNPTLSKEDAASIEAMCTVQPNASFQEHITLAGARDRIVRKSYTRAHGFSMPPFDKAFATAKAEKWGVQLPCGHDLMIEMPEETTQFLIQAAS